MLSFVSLTWYRFDEKRQSMEPGFPKQIVEDFPGVEPEVDAVFEVFGKRILLLLAVGHLKHSIVPEERGKLKNLITVFFNQFLLPTLNYSLQISYQLYDYFI